MRKSLTLVTMRIGTIEVECVLSSCINLVSYADVDLILLFYYINEFVKIEVLSFVYV